MSQKPFKEEALTLAHTLRTVGHPSCHDENMGLAPLCLPSGNSAGIRLAFSFLFIQFEYLHGLVLLTYRGNLLSSDKPFWKSSTDILRGMSSRWF